MKNALSTFISEMDNRTTSLRKSVVKTICQFKLLARVPLFLPDFGKVTLNTLKVRKGSSKEIPLIQGKEQRLCFAGAAIKRYSTPKVRETQVRW